MCVDGCGQVKGDAGGWIGEEGVGVKGGSGGLVGGPSLSCGWFLYLLACLLVFPFFFLYFQSQRKNSSCCFAHTSCQRNQDCNKREKESSRQCQRQLGW